ncbi:hypothetical protein B0A55_11507, partial [Friedmanniomyces simplex]
SGGGGGGRKPPGGGGRKPAAGGVSKPSSKKNNMSKKGGSKKAVAPPADDSSDDNDDVQDPPEAVDDNDQDAPGAVDDNAPVAPGAVDDNAPVAPVEADDPGQAAGNDQGAPAAVGDEQPDAPAAAGGDQAPAPDNSFAELNIYPDPNQLARLAYNASFFLNLDPEDPAKETLVSTIEAWRIEKRTAAKPNAKEGWIHDFLRSKPRINNEDSDGDDHWIETWQCLRALYTMNGTVKASTQAFKTELLEDAVIFIEMIHTLPAYAGKSLLSPMLTLFRSLLQQLPEWFAFDGMLVLVPAQPAGERGDMWESVEQAEKQLTGIYSRTDNYVLVVNRAPIGGRNGTLIRVMGRKVTDVDNAADAGGPVQDPADGTGE